MENVLLYDVNGEELSKAILLPVCSICGKEEEFELTEQETKTLGKYICYGRQMGTIQELFPRVPAWIRSGAIDRYSNGFCMCPECCGWKEIEE